MINQASADLHCGTREENMKPTSHCPSERISVLLTITPRNKSEKITAFYRSLDLNFNLISPCYGAAGLEIMDILGLTESEKDMIITVGHEDDVDHALQAVRSRFELKEPGSGIAFTIPINGISGPKAYAYVTAMAQRSEEK